MLVQRDIEEFCRQKNYDLRESGNGRWIDQKCAADVVTVVADCIYNYCIEHDGEFYTKDIWFNGYTINNVEAIFMKPGVARNDTKNEYDKFFQQPMELLAYSGILGKRKDGRRNAYWVREESILEYIALRERNALVFIKTYVEKVLKDSGIYGLFDEFFVHQDRDTFTQMKSGFATFIIANTKINGVVECNRIFIKVLNPLAFYKRSRGTDKGRLSDNAITYDMLMYNRNNFRDIYANKPKGVTRQEYATTHPVEVNDAYYHYQSSRAKRFLRLFNDQYRESQTEYIDGITNMNDPATQVHHIFPEARYPEICYYLENLITLTPTQHLSYAHPMNRTQEIDEQYQQLLLLAKTDRIQDNLSDDTVDDIYDFDNLIHVLNVGFDEDDVLEIAENDYQTVINTINVHYGDVGRANLVAEQHADYE